ncbi:GGDEF domain-containing protein [Bordetella sp. LUAb4]|uniref:GGDEF domain-containing protein n=1 Tax=Bordetella sp. LUAb4 TaxID=2843195 RepID=UPI001E54B359|nr:GGDEF domain-containing protein [Bordetella sp. LUAb4]
MISPTIMMIIAMLACMLMLGAMGTLSHTGTPGVLACLRATALTVISIFLLASQPLLPPLIGVVVGNTLGGAATTLYLVAALQFFGRPVPARGLVAIVLLEAAGLAIFWYVWRDFAIRIVIISVMHCTLTAAIAVNAWRYRPLNRPAYPYMFMLGMAALQAVAHAVRAVVYLLRLDNIDALHQMSPLHMVFLSVDLVTLPGLTLGMIIMVHDRMLSVRELEVGMDSSTGALSRKAWWLLAEKTVVRATRNNQRFCVLVLEIDRFLQINQTYGRLLAEAVLQHFAALAADVLREEDLIGRIDGEKFAILYPDIRLDAAHSVSENLLQAVRENACAYGNWSIGYTFSAGLVQWDGRESAQEVTERAEQALYRASAGGRDRIVAQRQLQGAG